MAKKEKIPVTQAMRMLKSEKIDFTVVTYVATEEMLSDGFGEKIAELTSISSNQAFKTLVGRDDKGEIIVLVIPVCFTVDLKKVAKAIGSKKVELIHVRELLDLTGYIRGSVSPIGMKKKYKTIININALDFPWIGVSGGKCGITLKVKTDDIIKITNAICVDIVSR